MLALVAAVRDGITPAAVRHVHGWTPSTLEAVLASCRRKGWVIPPAGTEDPVHLFITKDALRVLRVYQAPINQLHHHISQVL